MDPLSNSKDSCPDFDACGGQAGPPPPPPLTQVKILRRPKPNETNHHSNSHQQSTGNGITNQTTASSTNAAGNALKPNHMTPAARLTSEQTAASSAKYEAEWPSLGDALSNGPGSQRQSQQSRPCVAEPKAIISRQVVSGLNGQESNHMNSGQSDRASNGVNRLQQQPQGKAPLKTYKERADEYAKARLRILGSAFSEDDKKDDPLASGR